MEIGPLFAHFSDFLNYCHFTSHDTQTLGYMRDSLHRFKLECERHFMRFHPTKLSTPKYHLLEHYTSFVERFGSLLNGDTDTTDVGKLGTRQRGQMKIFPSTFDLDWSS